MRRCIATTAAVALLVGGLGISVIVDLRRRPLPPGYCAPVARALGLGCPAKFVPPPKIGLM